MTSLKNLHWKKMLCCSAFLLALGIQAQTTPVTFPWDGQSRNVIIHLPPGYNAANSYPLVFNLHGYQSNAQQQMLYSGMNGTADTYNFIVAYPDGLNNQWNSGWAGVYGSGTDDIGFIDAFIDYMDQHFSIDLDRVYACGMSNGGYQVNRMACELSHRIAAVASVTGLMTDSTHVHCAPQRAVPMMQVHGTADPIVPASGPPLSLSEEETIWYWVQENGCDTTANSTALPDTDPNDACTAVKMVYASCAAGTENWRYIIQNGGHTWPGAISIPAFGNTCKDFDASEHIWWFFSKYSLQGPLSAEEQLAGATMEVYPNPASGFIYVNGTKGERIQVLATSGALLKEVVLGGGNQQIDLSLLKPGIYWLRSETGRSTKIVRL